MIESCKLRQGQFTECYEILNLHTHTVLHQCVFGEIVCQHLGFTVVTPVHRRNGCKCIKCYHNVFQEKNESFYLIYIALYYYYRVLSVLSILALAGQIIQRALNFVQS